MKTLITILFVVALLSCETDSVGDCTVNATVRDLTGFDGCGFVLELEGGSRIEPILPFMDCGTPPLPKEITEDPLYNFEFIDGKRVRVSYTETGNPSICMVGPVVKITCITEGITTSSE
jgi:hypothetical protein